MRLHKVSSSWFINIIVNSEFIYIAPIYILQAMRMFKIYLALAAVECKVDNIAV
jgi:hypothetical protein